MNARTRAGGTALTGACSERGADGAVEHVVEGFVVGGHGYLGFWMDDFCFGGGVLEWAGRVLGSEYGMCDRETRM